MLLSSVTFKALYCERTQRSCSSRMVENQEESTPYIKRDGCCWQQPLDNLRHCKFQLRASSSFVPNDCLVAFLFPDSERLLGRRNIFRLTDYFGSADNPGSDVPALRHRHYSTVRFYFLYPFRSSTTPRNNSRIGGSWRRFLF